MKIVKTIIKSGRNYELEFQESLFSKALLERLYVHAKQLFEKFLIDNNGSVYFIYQISFILTLTC